MSSQTSPELTGTLWELPFAAGPIAEATAPIFDELATKYALENVLVLKRFPTGIEEIEHAYAEAAGGIEQPTVVGLTAHATRTIRELPDPPMLLDQGERNLLLETFLDQQDWTDEYLARASKHESFTADVGRFVSEATWQGGAIETDDPTLEELATTNAAFHDWLDAAHRLDPARSLRLAADALATDAHRDRIQDEFDAVLVLEFEEFTAIDREYLAQLTLGLPLYCVAEADSAIQRTWNEPRSIAEHVPSMESAESAAFGETERTAPGVIASYLARGGAEGDPSDAEGSVSVIEAERFSDELAAIAEEIERLHGVEGVPYDEMAVVLRDSNAPIPEALRGLRAAGIPVASATVGGLEHDPAARELYALTSLCVRHAAPDLGVGGSADERPGWDEERARAVLQARIGGVVESLDEILATVRERAEAHGLADGLNYWLLATGLKHRIANDQEPLEAKTQFGHVRTLRQLVQAVDDSTLLDSSWRTLCIGLEQELQRATTDKIATDLALPEGGVLVDAARIVKNEERRAVFLADVIDREYPAEPQFTSLFPTPHLEQLDGYPAFTTPSAADVRATFTPSDDPTRPLHAYYAALSRRMLAIGARCASDALYLCYHREDSTGTGSRQQPSRFLAELEDTFGAFPRVDHDGIYSHGEAVQFALSRLDETLDQVRQAGLVTEPIDIADIEAEFEAVQRILDSDPPADLRPAIEARLDFAEGGVRRE